MKMRNRFVLPLILAGAACALGPAAAPAAAAAPAKGASAGVEAQPSGIPIDYAELEQKIGADLVVETRLNTTRRGTLIKYTNVAIVLQLGAEAGSIKLTVQRDSIRHITLVDAPAAIATPQGTGSAKKN